MATVTELSVQKKNSNRFNLFIDKSFFCGLSVATVANFAIYEGKILTDDDLKLIFLHDLEERIFDRTCNFLSRALKTKKEVETYIDNIFYKKAGDWWSSELEIPKDKMREDILGRLERIGLINDEIYVSAFLRDRQKFKPKSSFALKYELIAKGISETLLEELLVNNIDDFEMLKLAYFKKYKTELLTQDDHKKIDFLRRKGFSWDLISRFIKEQGVN